MAPDDLLVGDSYFCAAPAPRDYPPSCFTALTTATTSPEFVVSGSVNGIPVDANVIDTACTRTMVHRSLISEECLTGDHITIRCAHGDEMVYPLACITLAVGTLSYFLTVVVSDTLPHTVLLGLDVPGIQTLLQTLPLGQAEALRVTTRSHGPGKATPAARENPTQDMKLASLFPFHEDLFAQPRQTRPMRDNVPILATDVPHSQPVPGDLCRPTAQRPHPSNILGASTLRAARAATRLLLYHPEWPTLSAMQHRPHSRPNNPPSNSTCPACPSTSYRVATGTCSPHGWPHGPSEDSPTNPPPLLVARYFG